MSEVDVPDEETDVQGDIDRAIEDTLEFEFASYEELRDAIEE